MGTDKDTDRRAGAVLEYRHRCSDSGALPGNLIVLLLLGTFVTYTVALLMAGWFWK